MQKTLYLTDTSIFTDNKVLKNFPGINFHDSLILRELINAIRHFRGSKKEFDFAILAHNTEIRKLFFPRKFFPCKCQNVFVLTFYFTSDTPLDKNLGYTPFKQPQLTSKFDCRQIPVSCC